MTLRLSRINISEEIVNAQRQPTPKFQKGVNDSFSKIETNVTDLEETIARIKRNFSHTDPTTIFSALDVGATTTLTISDHIRFYGDGTQLEVDGGVLSGLAGDTVYAVYYDDTTLADTTPTYVATTVIKDAQFVAAAGRHYCGVIRTPVAGSGATRTGGGVYPVGSSMGGEL